MSDQPYTIEQALTALDETPTRIVALTGALSAAQLQARPESEAWSINEILAHLRACADVWGGYIARIIAEDTPTIRVVSPRSYIKRTDYPQQVFAPSFRAFAAQRAELLTVLERLTAESWSRAAMVTAPGKTYPRTILDYAERMARHEREHLRQIKHTAEAISG